MKKIIGLFLAFALVLFPVNVVHANPYEEVLINAQLLDDSPTSITSSGISIKGAKKVGFYVTYDETEVGATVGGTLTFEISYDNSTYFAASFYDFAGGATLQASEVWTGDANYYCWLNADSPFMFVRAKVVATNTDADDTVSVSVRAVIQK